MAFRVFTNSQQGAAFVLCLVTIPLCTIATALRVESTRRARRKIGLEDGFAMAALVFHLVFTTMFTWVVVQLNGRQYAEVYLDSPASLRHILKVGWIMSAQYAPNQYFAKLSLLALYHRLFSVNRTFNRCCQALAILQTLWFIGAYVTKYLLCFPVRRIYDLDADGSCIDIGPFLAATESVNSLIDFAMIGLAIWVINTLQMDSMTKWKLSILFSVGCLSGIVGFVKIGEAYTSAYANQLSGIWDVVQMATSIICCCAPVYRSVLPRIGLFAALRSTFGRSSRTRKTADSSSPSARHNTSAASGETSFMGKGRPRGSGRDGIEDEAWLRLEEDGSRDKGSAAWASVESGPYHYPLQDRVSGSQSMLSQNVERA